VIFDKRFAVALLGLLLVIAGAAEAAQCGSALLLETAAPAVFDGFDPAAPSVARFWEAGLAGSNRSDTGCQAGCTAASGPRCAGGGNCLALTGVSWLNAACGSAGHLPARSVFLVEQTTTDSGGRWAAINLDHDSTDGNTDLDAKASAVCGGCASVLSPYLGGSGTPTVDSSSASGGNLLVALSWSGPPAAAQALSNGSDLVTGYGVFYRTDAGSPSAATGDPTDWTRAFDTQADGQAGDGYSGDTSAALEITLAGLLETISFAVGPTFDGTGNPTADGNTLSSAFLSDASPPLTVPTGCGEPNNRVLEAQTIDDPQTFIACLTVTAGNGFRVGANGNVTLTAGQQVALTGGFSVASGGRLVIRLDPALSQ